MPDLSKTFHSRHRRPLQRQGGSTHLRDHSRAYKALRASVLDDEPLCCVCLSGGLIVPATIADHRIALSIGGTNDRVNLAGMCQPHNQAKSLSECRFVAKGYDSRDLMLDPDMREWLRLLDAGKALQRKCPQGMA